MSLKLTAGALSFIAATAAAEPPQATYLQSSVEKIPLTANSDPKSTLKQALKLVVENTNFDAPMNNWFFSVNYKLASIVIAKPDGETIKEIGGCFYYAASGLSRGLNRMTLGLLGSKESSITCEKESAMVRTEAPLTGSPRILEP